MFDCIVTSVKFGGGGVVFQELVAVKEIKCFSIPRHLRQFHAPDLVGTVWASSFSNMTRTSALSKVHRDMDERYRCGRT